MALSNTLFHEAPLEGQYWVRTEDSASIFMRPNFEERTGRSMATQLNQQGVTLLELLVVITIIGVMTSVGVVVARSLGPEMRIDSAAREIRSDFQKTKLVAVRANSDCVIDFNTSGSGTYEACIDADGSNTCGSGEEIILEKDFSDKSNISLKNAAFTYGNYIQFNSRGLTGPITGWSSGSVNCTNENNDLRSITVTRTGEIYID